MLENEDREFNISDEKISRDEESKRENSIPMDNEHIEAESLVIPSDDSGDDSNETTESLGNDVNDILSSYFGSDDNDKDA